jgi:NAD(P)-dependent dehydrogenase (short-subunit alcohol dehydrogenase family)
LAGPYSASKFAGEGFSDALAGEVQPFGLHVTIVQPGGFHTSFMRDLPMAQQPVPVYQTSVANIVDFVQASGGQQLGDPAKAAQAIIQAVQSPPSHCD